MAAVPPGSPGLQPEVCVISDPRPNIPLRRSEARRYVIACASYGTISIETAPAVPVRLPARPSRLRALAAERPPHPAAHPVGA